LLLEGRRHQQKDQHHDQDVDQRDDDDRGRTLLLAGKEFHEANG
jgi:hypothetical protein